MRFLNPWYPELDPFQLFQKTVDLLRQMRVQVQESMASQLFDGFPSLSSYLIFPLHLLVDIIDLQFRDIFFILILFYPFFSLLGLDVHFSLSRRNLTLFLVFVVSSISFLSVSLSSLQHLSGLLFFFFCSIGLLGRIRMYLHFTT